MKEEDIKDFRPVLPEPTEEEIEKATATVRAKFGKELSVVDATAFAMLKNELAFWVIIEKEYEEKGISGNWVGKVRKVLKKKYGDKVSSEKASLEVEKALLTMIMYEKVRISDEMNAILDKYQ